MSAARLVDTLATYSGRRTTTFTDSSGVFVLPAGASSWTDVSDARMHYWVKDLVVDPNDASQGTWYVGVFQAWSTSAAADSNHLELLLTRSPVEGERLLTLMISEPQGGSAD